ncbi:hypothetical protein [Salinigranum sp. GCM10025319]|uniref:hypothetical protein n=1 Tax=Salinigranum sp. GCM10025319 TaxID=3252687 RepID=UPI00361416DD
MRGPTGDGTALTAHVWASVPDTLLGTLVEWDFRHLLDGITKDYDHVLTELEYITARIESS